MDALNFSRLMSDDTDFIPLVTNEEDNNLPEADVPEVVGILPLRNTVLFPGVVSPVTAGRDKSIKLIQDAQKGKKIFGVMAQRNPDTQDPEADDLHEVGTLVQMVRMFRMPDGNITAHQEAAKGRNHMAGRFRPFMPMRQNNACCGNIQRKT